MRRINRRIVILTLLSIAGVVAVAWWLLETQNRRMPALHVLLEEATQAFLAIDESRLGVSHTTPSMRCSLPMCGFGRGNLSARKPCFKSCFAWRRTSDVDVIANLRFASKWRSGTYEWAMWHLLRRWRQTR
jgi:hypothetical protein